MKADEFKEGALVYITPKTNLYPDKISFDAWNFNYVFVAKPKIALYLCHDRNSESFSKVLFEGKIYAVMTNRLVLVKKSENWDVS